MDSLFNISLYQGKQFKKYQQKISKGTKRKENFTSNDTDSTDFNQLRSEYNDASQRYNDLQKQALDKVKASGQVNPYLNKTVRFTTGHAAYVTNEGVVKYIPTGEIWSFTGVPYSYIDIPVPWLAEYGNPGVTIPTTPPLVTGTFLTYQTVGNEGKSVYVSNMLNTITSSFLGCFNNTPVLHESLFVPIMTSSNVASNNMKVNATSVLSGNNDAYGPWHSFDRDPNTFWHSEGDRYDWNTGDVLTSSPLAGQYTDRNGNLQPIIGEYLMVTMPDFEDAGTIKYVLTKYDLKGRIGYPERCPNDWVILGAKGPAGPDTNWIELDSQTGKASDSLQTFTVSNAPACCAFLLLTSNIGTDGYSGNRGSIQISIWNLYTNSGSSGSYTGSGADAMTYSGYDSFSYDQCQKYAADNEFSYFSIKDMNTSSGTGKCYVSNSEDTVIAYGDASTNPSYSMEYIWACNDTWGTDAAYAYVGDDGRLVVGNAAGTVIWGTPAVDSCVNGGKMNLDSLTATYGGNCDGNNGWSVAQNNAVDKVKQAYIDAGYPGQMSFPVNNGTLGDPASGCGKGWDTSYQCGTAWKSTHIDYAEGQIYIYDCSEESSACTFFLLLQDDGNMCVYNGTIDATNGPAVWCSMTNGKQKDANPEWAASNSKYGRNYLKQGETLAKGEWVSSTNGSIKLLLQEDGNLVLYTSFKQSQCLKSGDINYGTNGFNAVYKLDKIGDQTSLGKIGYVDSNSVLMEYPDSMLKLSNNYTILPSIDSPYNDLATWGNMTQDECQSRCNEYDECYGYSYGTDQQTCWLKTQGMYPRGSKTYNPNRIMGIRKPMLTGSQTCGTDIVDIDTIQYDNYVKGAEMTPDTMCHPYAIPPETRAEMSSLEDQMNGLGQQMGTQMNALYTDNTNLFQQLNTSQGDFHDKMNNFKYIKSNMDNINSQDSKNINGKGKEGMLTMDDTNQMVTDTGLIVLQQNYIYMIWTALALLFIILTVSILRKSLTN
jgi:PAN domain